MVIENKILVTGASGFIGKHLIKKLLSNKYEVACVDLRYDNGFNNSFDSSVRFYSGNLLDKDFISLCIKEFAPHYIFHLAGSKSRSNNLPEFKSSYDVNYLGTLNLFEACIGRKELKLMTLIGTVEEYGRSFSPFKEDNYELPVSSYGLSKLSATKLSLIFNSEFNIPALILRPSIAYGPGQGEDMFLPALINALLKSKSFKMTQGHQMRDFVFIDDLVQAMIRGIEKNDVAGNIINIAAGKSVRLKDVAMQISNLTGNAECLEFGAIPYRSSEIMDYAVNIDKSYEILNWKPETSLDKGLFKTVEYYKEHMFDET